VVEKSRENRSSGSEKLWSGLLPELSGESGGSKYPCQCNPLPQLRLRGLDLTRQVAFGASFPLSAPIDGAWPDRFSMPVLCLLSLISRNSPKQLGMVSPELASPELAKELGMVSPELKEPVPNWPMNSSRSWHGSSREPKTKPDTDFVFSSPLIGPSGTVEGLGRLLFPQVFPDFCGFSLDTAIRPVSNIYSEEPGKVADSEVNGDLGNPGKTSEVTP